jgi:uncharacterized membrane protein
LHASTVSLVLTILLASANAVHAQTLYRVIPVDTFGQPARATGLNDSGQVVGFGDLGVDYVDGLGRPLKQTLGFVSDQTNGTQVIQPLPLGPDNPFQRFTQASGINDNGQVIGTSHFRDSTTNQNSQIGFVRDPVTGALQDIGNLGGNITQPMEINGNSIVTGNSRNSAGSFVPFVWDQSNGIRSASDVFGLANIVQFGGAGAGTPDFIGRGRINDNNQVLFATSAGSSSIDHIGNLNDGSSQQLGSGVRGNDLNDAAQVVGWKEAASGQSAPVLVENGTTVNLPRALVTGFNGARATGINNSGQAVGFELRTSTSPASLGRVVDVGPTVVWDLLGNRVDVLSDLVDPAAGLAPILGNVAILNDLGQIVVTTPNPGIVAGADPRVYLLDPLAPGTAARLDPGLSMMAAVLPDGTGDSLVQAMFDEVTGPGGLFIGNPIDNLMQDLSEEAFNAINFTPLMQDSSPVGFNLEMTGTFNGGADVTLKAAPAIGFQNGVQLFHYTGTIGGWQSVAFTGGASPFVSFRTNSFSPFLFGTTSTASEVPEPTSFCLLAMGAVGLLGVRRRRRERAS